MIIAVDWDGVIHDKKHPVEGKRLGPPMPGAREAMYELGNQGHLIIIHTVMAQSERGVEMVEDWLVYYNIPGSVWRDLGKPRADIYLDDKAIRFTNWKRAVSAIMKADEAQKM